MDFLQLIFVIVACGVVLFVINKYVPMQPKIKEILNWVVIGVLICWLLSVFGFFTWLSHIHLGKIGS